jgi:hypothetical protein
MAQLVAHAGRLDRALLQTLGAFLHALVTVR